ncbi:DUF2380 domain-containing protein [Mongoliitalea daihaiensis]|uniref:DUF2380 domain-containing protein n=1 Tax=Mongoliitalea daihaiensis TaxID=2782006 RepID=UPI001F1D5550|nr:DUF2380 domain-containing protein [Mongoliitalea daihaiensis]UJP65151.1 DUF2380 domain-containing protein [Mongoliitalea daihaiensis]
MISCHNPIDLSGGSGGANWPTHPNPSGPSGEGSGGGGPGSGAFGSTGGGSGTSNGVCDHTNNFASDCIPFPVTNPEDRRRAQLDYLRTHGGRDFVNIIEELLTTPGLKVGDVSEINILVNNFYLRQKGLFMMNIFSIDNVGMILTLGIWNPNLTTIARNKTFQLFSRYATQNNNVVFKSFTSNNFRSNLTLKTGMNPSGAQAHHVFPQTSEFSSFFTSKGINVHNPSYGTWWPTASHQSTAYAYNQAWRIFIANNPNATTNQILNFARTEMAKYGIAVLF